MILSASIIALWLQLSAWHMSTTSASTLRVRDPACSEAETNVLKCLSNSQYYICPAPGQAPIIQDVAAGTQCLAGALIPIGKFNPNFGGVLDSVAANMAAASFVVPPEAPPSPTPSPAPSPEPSPAPSPEPTPSAESPPPRRENRELCPYGGYPIDVKTDCKDYHAIKRTVDVTMLTPDGLYCPTNLRYAFCNGIYEFVQTCEFSWESNTGCAEFKIRENIREVKSGGWGRYN